MKIYVDGKYLEQTAEEVDALNAITAQTEAEYWADVDYHEAVNARIREKYSMADEFGLLRQMLKKPEEFAAYFNYCEECKAFVKEKKGMS